jgi:hypothetical protein
MTTRDDLIQTRARLIELVEINRSAQRTRDTIQKATDYSLRVRDLCERFYREEAHLWSHIKPSPELSTNWDQILAWCHEFVGEGNYLVYLPRGEPRVLLLQNPGHATYIKLTFG